MEKNKAILKSISMFFIYFVITIYGGQMLLDLGIKSNILRMFLKDIFFMAIIVTAYFKNLKSDYADLKKRYTLFKFIKTVFLGTLIIIAAHALIGLLLNFASMENPPSNAAAIQELAKQSVLYVIFKTMIFAIIAEKLLFVESIRDFIDNKWLFIITSALLFTIMNNIFISDFSKVALLELVIPAIVCFTSTIVLLIIYIQNKSNIILLMSIVFVYSFLPLLGTLFS